MEMTLVILKPSCIMRSLVGVITTRFEQKGLRLAGSKMIQLSDSLLDEHYKHLKDKPFFPDIKKSMMASPVVIQCWEGIDAIQVVRKLTGFTNGREAHPGTIRGDFSMSLQENIVHASDSPENANSELNRFFKKEEIFVYEHTIVSKIYSKDEKKSNNE